MRKKYEWKFLTSCENERLLENVLDKERKAYKKKNSQLEKCQVCKPGPRLTGMGDQCSPGDTPGGSPGGSLSDSSVACPLESATSSRSILRVGDEILYYSPMFVAGDKRGLRKAVIERIDPDADELYSVRLNRLELLPMYTYVSRTSNLDGSACSPRWSALRNYSLVPGYKRVRHQERDSVEAIKTTVSSAVQQVLNSECAGDEVSQDGRQHFPPDQDSSSAAGERFHPDPPDLDSSNAAHLASESVDNEQEAEDSRLDAEGDDIDQDVLQSRLFQLGQISTRAQRDKKQHRGKDRLGLRRKSKKRCYQKKRKTTTDGSSVILPRTLEEKFLRDYLKNPKVLTALRTSKKGAEDASHSS